MKLLQTGWFEYLDRFQILIIFQFISHLTKDDIKPEITGIYNEKSANVYKY